MRRVLLAWFLGSVIGCAGVVLTEMPAHACRCLAADTAEHAKKANTVFAGTIVAIEAPATRVPASTVTFTVEVERAWKNTLPSRVDVQSPSDATSCGLAGLQTDRRYVFFGQLEGGVVEANSCGGTAPASDQLVADVQAALGTTGTPLSTPETSPVTTRVTDAEPMGFARLAAPGGALVIVGLLGLLLVQRLGRQPHP